MNAFKVSTLHNLALHCGYPTLANKAARILAIERAATFADLIPTKDLRVLSVDVGVKNFSYCKASYSSVQLPVPKIALWNHHNLHDCFGSNYTLKTGDADSLVDSKAYLAQLAVSVVDEIFLDPEWVPHVITIENQRTRSNNNNATLPNVLLNYTLEHMVYSAFAARQTGKSLFKNTLVVPVNSNKMVNFWITRFVDKGVKVSSANSKKMRASLLYGWISEPESAPFDLSCIVDRLPSDFASLSKKEQTASFLNSFDAPPAKADDLIDCLLYNFAFVLQLNHHLALQKVKDVDALIEEWDTSHCQYIEPVLTQYGLELSHDFQ